MTELGAVLAWLGISAAVLAQGRAARAGGLLMAALGAALTLSTTDPASAAALAGGGAVAAALGLRSGPPGWAMFAAGSTPRLILVLVGGVLSAWMAISVIGGPGPWPPRFAVLAIGIVAGARLLTVDSPRSAAIEASALALAAGLVGVVVGSPHLGLALAGGMGAVILQGMAGTGRPAR